MERRARHIHQLLRIHVVQDPLGVLAVATALHYSKQQLARVVLQLEHEIHARLAQRIDVVENEGGDDVQAVGLVGGYAVLVVVAGTLAVLGQGLEGLVDQSDVVLVDVETEKTEAARRRAADAVEEHQGLGDQVEVGLVVLIAQEVLKRGGLEW